MNLVIEILSWITLVGGSIFAILAAVVNLCRALSVC